MPNSSVSAVVNIEHFDVYMSYAHEDGDWVEKLAERLEDQEGFNVWLDKWILIPGEPWQQGMAQGLYNADCCAVCVSEQTPAGWFHEEIQKALHRQVRDPSFRVIAVLLPNAKKENIAEFLELRTWVDFGNGADAAYAFYRLVCGIRGIPPGRWPPKGVETRSENTPGVERDLQELEAYRRRKLIKDEIALEFQRDILTRRFNKGNKE